MKKRVIIIIAIIIFLIVGITVKVNNKENANENITYLEIIKAVVVDDFGTWKVDFSEPVEINDNIGKNIMIIGIDGVPIEIDFSYADYENKSLLIKPKNNDIQPGEEYILSISGINSVDGNQLKGLFSKNFKLERKPINIVSAVQLNDYDWEVVFDQEVLKGDKTNENIKIYKSNDNEIRKKIDYKEGSNNTLIIRPEKNDLRIGETYTLYIGGVIESKKNARLNNSITKSFKVSKIEIDEKLGLGKVETERKSNDREYSWYIDQQSTGEGYENNGAVSAAVMAAKWAKPNNEFSVEGARQLYYPNGDLWYWHTIVDYLTHNNIETEVEEAMTSDKLKAHIDNNKIVILNIDSTKIPIDMREESHTNRFDKDLRENFIIVKGYRVVDNKLYFEIYDPYSLNRLYVDSSPKGKDRYYSSSSLISGLKSIEGKAIVVSESAVN